MPSGGFTQSCVWGWRIQQGFHKGDPVALRQIREFARSDNTLSGFDHAVHNEVGQRPSLNGCRALAESLGCAGYPSFQACISFGFG
jgi:hypothetical protein